MMKTLVVLISLIFYSLSFSQDQYFTDESSWRLPDTSLYSTAAKVGDIDGDGDIDICVATFAFIADYGPVYLLINDGYSNYTFESYSRLPYVYWEQNNCAFGDIDRDGDLDLYICNSSYGPNSEDDLYINDGFGYFEDQTDIRMPTQVNGTLDAVFADFTENFALDILVQSHFHTNSGTRLLSNDSFGFFTEITQTNLPPDLYDNLFITVLDIDNDLDLDFIESCVGNGNPSFRPQFYRNMGEGYFVFIEEAIDVDHARYITVGDIDLDSDLDVFISSGVKVKLYINSNGVLVDESLTRLPDSGLWIESSNMALGDFDNDGDLDAYITRTNYNQSYFLINDGSGFYDFDNTRIPENLLYDNWAEPFDADADGDLDLFLSCTGDGYQKLLINHSTPDSFPPNILAKTIYYGILDSAEYYPVRISAWDNISVALGELTGKIHYRTNNGTFTELDLLPLGGTIFGERIPGQSSGTHIEYYIEMIDRMGNTTLVPDSAPDSIYSFWVEEITGVISDDEVTISKSTLSAYPNPFNAQTVISYSLRKSSNVNLSIYNIIGQRVAILSDGVQPAGEHSIVWNADYVPSGIYFARLEFENNADNIKMVLLK